VCNSEDIFVDFILKKIQIYVGYVCAVVYLQASTPEYYYYWYSALGPVWAETRVQSGDWYGSGTLHPGQVLRCSLPLLSPAF